MHSTQKITLESAQSRIWQLWMNMEMSWQKNLRAVVLRSDSSKVYRNKRK
jgi:hypothetical protein